MNFSRKNNIIYSISVTLYILFLYVGIEKYGLLHISSITLDIFILLTVFRIITDKLRIIVTPYLIWYFIFGFLGLISVFYSLDQKIALEMVFTILVNLIVVFAFTQFVRNINDLKFVISIFAYSGMMFVLSIAINGDLFVDTRLGLNLSINPNRIGTILLISLFCLIWLLLYGNKKYFLFNLVCLIAVFYVTGLTGGRKYLLMPFIFILLLFILNSRSKKLAQVLLYLVLFAVFVFAGIYSVLNSPILYNITGQRFEGLLAFFQGDYSRVDESTSIRYMMIQLGINAYFPKRPILGYGIDNYRVLNPFGDFYAHNNFVELIVDLGIIGFLAYYTYYVVMIWRLYKIKNDKSGFHNFFLSFLLTMIVLEIGAITYSVASFQIFLGLCSGYIHIYHSIQQNIYNKLNLHKTSAIE